MKILALDISLLTGWACGFQGHAVFGLRDFHGVSGDRAVLGRLFSEWLNRLLTQHEPAILVIERPFLRNEGTSYLLGGLVWEAHRAAELRNIPRREIPPVSIKKFITGRARADKADVIQAVRARGHAVRDDNEADAVALFLCAEACL